MLCKRQALSEQEEEEESESAEKWAFLCFNGDRNALEADFSLGVLLATVPLPLLEIKFCRLFNGEIELSLNKADNFLLLDEKRVEEDVVAADGSFVRRKLLS